MRFTCKSPLFVDMRVTNNCKTKYKDLILLAIVQEHGMLMENFNRGHKRPVSNMWKTLLGETEEELNEQR